MAKKCIPGLFCVENMTLFILFVVLVLFLYFYYVSVLKPMHQQQQSEHFFQQPAPMAPSTPTIVLMQPPQMADALQSVYIPPVKVDQPRGQGIMGLPINMSTQGPIMNYSQIGLLTRLNGSGDMVLPLMGRQTPTGRSKYQYYTMMPSGNLNTKLPVSVNGKSCTSEYGCDEISSGDVVYVDGINDTFRATVYESGLFSYIPY
jgi:hypothetical protein